MQSELLNLISRIQDIFNKIHAYKIQIDKTADDPIVQFLENYFMMPERQIAYALHHAVVAKGTPKIYNVLNSIYYKGKYEIDKVLQHQSDFIHRFFVQVNCANSPCTVDLGRLITFYCAVIPGTLRIQIDLTSSSSSSSVVITDNDLDGILEFSSSNITGAGTIEYGSITDEGMRPALLKLLVQSPINNVTLTVTVQAKHRCVPEKFFPMKNVSYVANVFYARRPNTRYGEVPYIAAVTYTVHLALDYLITTVSPVEFYAKLVDYSHRLLLINKLVLSVNKFVTMLEPIVITLERSIQVISNRAKYGYSYIDVGYSRLIPQA